ncbi:MAG: hypothetical protein OXM00_08965 [Paracoccaceae bacterium]|nr:hypothetical protein [Nitrososphaerota archaeon]MDE2917347.1 hypothetical protein [Paracoccaceae bacterium]
MGKQCVLCEGNINMMLKSYKISDKRGKLEEEAQKKGTDVVLDEMLPRSLPDDGHVCYHCWDNVSNAVKDPSKTEERKQAQEARLEARETKQQDAETKQQDQEARNKIRAALNERVDEYKRVWDKSGVIQFKNERMAILHRIMGAQVQFIIAFDDLTREGYRCVAQDEGKEASGGTFAGGVDSYYYFQKIEYIGFDSKVCDV